MYFKLKLFTFLFVAGLSFHGCGGNGGGSEDNIPLLVFDQITSPSQLTQYPNGNYTVTSYSFEGDILNMEVNHTSCEENRFSMIMSSYGQSTGTYGNAFLAHPDDSDLECAVQQSQTVQIDFTPLKNLVEDTEACTDGVPNGQKRCEILLYGPHGSGQVQQTIRYQF